MSGAGLLEREDELDRLREGISAAAGGSGSGLLIEGEAGIGKSALLRRAGALAGEAGFRVLQARGGTLEQEFAYGLVRQLLERELAASDPERRASRLSGAAALAAPIVAPAPAAGAGPGPSDAQAFEHGLYWLLSNLAEERPLALLLDDLHWSDASTLRLLVYLARRLEAMPVAVLGTVRLGETDGSTAPLIDALRDEPAVESIELGPLGEESVALLVTAGLGRESAREFTRACRDVSGGNPYLLSELLQTLIDDGTEPTAADAKRVREVGPVAVSRSVLLRLARLPDEATALAQAVAILGAGAALREAAALAGLAEEAADTGADALAEARILARERPLEFLHPLVANAIYVELPTGRRARDHRRAAQLLAGEDAAPERVAAQLLRTEPAGDEWVARTLAVAADAALARGAPDVAAQLLRRALTEPPAEPERAGVVRALGSAQVQAGDLAGLTLLRRGLEATTDPSEAAAGALELASIVLVVLERPAEAASVLERAIRKLGADDPLIGRLDAALAVAAQFDVENASILDRRLELEADDLSGANADERLLLATLAYRCGNRGDSASNAVELAERALAGGRLLAEHPVDGMELMYAVVPLLLADSFGAAETAIEQFFARARSRGSWIAFGQASWLRAWLNYRLGALDEALTDARNVLIAEPARSTVSLGLLIDVLVERGELSIARAELDAANLDEARMETTTILPLFLLAGRGRLRIAQGDLQAGLDDLFELGRRCERWGDANPAQFSWRSDAALALIRLGDKAEALRLAEDELERARRFGAPRAIAIALRALAVVEGGPAGIDRLREALAVLEGSPARLTRAHVLVELGAALRRANQRAVARKILHEGYELAQRCEAGALSERAREELRAAGSRPRSVIRSGTDSLTPSERRVCRLAADGLSNPEIARSLFVTRATVESHLHAAYGKLGVTSRHHLKRALEPAEADREGAPAV